MVLARIKVVLNERMTEVKQMRHDIASLLQKGQEVTARILIEHLTRDQNSLAAYELIRLFCQLVVERLLIIEKQSLIFAAPRCCHIPELMTVRNIFEKKYGRDFVSAASDLRPECGVNGKMIENLSIKTPSGEVKLKLMKEIANEYRVEWDATEKEFFKPTEELIVGPKTFVSGATLPLQSVQLNKFEKTSGGERGNMHYQGAPSAAEAAVIFASEAMSAAQAAAILANQVSSQAPHCVDTVSKTRNIDDHEELAVDEEETLLSDDEIFARFQALKLHR
ncbi:putative vacuolar protein sorting-associated protein Ist1 [Rosa chinensis]|uniref:Putative vacuolar protein sorting-associated protein Ist1 n=1 Tax=Rosa chinensis TaxID=74649 RepID=A0A2P6RLF9_ROSCH|nr:putative vacuolar protein sorting-associated protein Ist1 [Rosa chinensis]